MVWCDNNISGRKRSSLAYILHLLLSQNFTFTDLISNIGSYTSYLYSICSSQILLRYKKDKNLLLLKTEMNAGHGGKSGRDGAIEEIALDYAFALKISKKI